MVRVRVMALLERDLVVLGAQKVASGLRVVLGNQSCSRPSEKVVYSLQVNRCHQWL